MAWIRPLSDVDLLARLKKGDERAFAQLYRRHQRAVYSFALLWSGSDSIAADTTQETFMHLMHSHHDFDPARGTLGAWLGGVARNFVRRTMRAFDAPMDPTDDDCEDSPDSPWLENQPFDELQRTRAAQAVRTALLDLEPHYRDVLVLCALQDRSYVEAAQICGIEVGTVRSRLSRAKAKLAQALHALGPTPAREAA